MGADARKWVLACGRFSPNAGAGVTARVLALEAYIAALSEELELQLSELMLSELGRATEAASVQTTSVQTTSAQTASAQTPSGEE